MVRPIISNGLNLQGSISDNIFLVCLNDDGVWAKIVFIKTDSFLHAVLIPILDNYDNLNNFNDFLENPPECIEISRCQFKNDNWDIQEERITIKWPKGN